jgi:hypothetical protein
MFDRRASFRKPVYIPAKLIFDGNEAEHDCLIVNISEEGAAVELELLDTPLPGGVSKNVTIKLVTGEVMTGTRIWGTGIRVGFKLSDSQKISGTGAGAGAGV